MFYFRKKGGTAHHHHIKLIEKKDSSQFLDELNEEFRIKNPKIANAFNKSKEAAKNKAYSLKEEYNTVKRNNILLTK